jgi:KipI family sensor histidine kinase inhibitor
MRILPSGSTALLAEMDDLQQVLALYAALGDQRPAGVVDLVPAARTLLIVLDPAVTTLAAVQAAVTATVPRSDSHHAGDLVEIPTRYDGPDLSDVAESQGCSRRDIVRRHTGQEWTVAFCGFAPGFGYLISADGGWDVPRQPSPRTAVPAGSVGLAGEFTGVYPQVSPGGWQLIGQTDVAVFDLERDPAALLRPGIRARFVEVDN